MVRASSVCCVRGALLALALVACAGGVSGAGGVASECVVDASDTVGNYTLSESNTHTKILTGEVERTVKAGDEFLDLMCNYNTGYNTDAALEDIRFPHFNDTTQSPNLVFDGCPVPRDSYADALAALHYRVADLKQLRLFIGSTQLLQASYFIGLPVEILWANYYNIEYQSKLVPLDPIILEPLLNLTSLVVFNVMLLPMPAWSRLRTVIAENGKSHSVWGGCDQLEEIVLRAWEVHSPDDVSFNWLANCTKLKNLVIKRQSMKSLVQIMRGVQTVPKQLQIVDIDPHLDMLLLTNYFTGLEELVLRNDYLVWFDIASIPTSVSYLELSDKDGFVMPFSWLQLLQQRPALRELRLDNTPLSTQICDQIQAATAPQVTLRRLSLINTGATRLCFGKWVSPQYLDLRNNSITTLELLELPEPRGEYEWTAVDLRGNPISSVPLTEEGYNTLLNKFNKVNVSLWFASVLNCDCEHAWFARVLRFPLFDRVEDGRDPVRCSDGKPLVDTPAEQLECERFPCEDCVCRRAWSDNTTVAFCEPRIGLQRVPHVPGLRALHAVGNSIDTLHDDDLPETLFILNISRNQISRLNESVVNKLFSVQERRVWLAGNPLDCDCDNRALLTALQRHRTQVEDYSNIVCVGSKQTLHSLVVGELCTVAGGQVAVIATLVVSGVLVALAELAAAVYCRYERQLRIFLYARGWCLCCVQEDDSDDERQFDAFVSFAHADEHLVTEQLLPELERAYKLCVHFRDWQPGELIPTQIRLSVERSRRTVIVLSRNFLHSMWAMLEFRTAHVSALSEGRVRMMVIVLDDVVDDEELDAELQGYLRMHTYLRWGDTWFWEKLRYALPHRRTPSIDDLQPPAAQPIIALDNVNMSSDVLQLVSARGEVSLSPHELQLVGARGQVNLSPHELQLVGARGEVSLSPQELKPVATRGEVNMSPHELQLVGARGEVSLSPHELQLVGARGEVSLSPHELELVGTRGEVNMSPHELELVATRGEVNISPHELQLVGARGEVNMSPHELELVGTRGEVNMSLHELQLVGARGEVNLSPHELQLVGARGQVNLSPHELQLVGARGEVSLSPHELKPVATRGEVNMSPHELQLVGARGEVSLSPHELQLVGARGEVSLSPHELELVGTRGEVNMSPHELELVATRGEVNMSPHELQLVGERGEISLSPGELQLVSARGEVNLSPHE